MKNHLSLSRIYLLLLLAASLQLAGCKKEGEGDTVLRTLTVAPLTGIDQAIDAEVVLEEGPTQKVEVSGQENIINLLQTGVEDGVWKIRFGKNVGRHEKLTVYVTAPALRRVAQSGSGSIQGLRPLTAADLEVTNSGSGSVRLATNATTVAARLSGSGLLELEGTTSSLTVRSSGSGKFRGFNLVSRAAEVSASGSGDSELTATATLRATVSGSGNVRYKGTPVVTASTTGSGRVLNTN